MWIEPVRDWNLVSVSVTDEGYRSVNWTCEGLKHCWNWWCNSWDGCVNWTCEGLKHIWREPTIGVDKGVNWTCEGLKLFIQNIKYKHPIKCELNLWGIETALVCDFSPKTKNVWIEPVRDWNSCSIICTSWVAKVWIEPVRDWNKLSSYFENPVVGRCELNLWGIETFLGS